MGVEGIVGCVFRMPMIQLAPAATATMPAKAKIQRARGP
jgi:hypothetical protein